MHVRICINQEIERSSKTVSLQPLSNILKDRTIAHSVLLLQMYR